MTRLIENERTKLLANSLDRASTACLTIGVLAPLGSVLFKSEGVAPLGGPMMIAAIIYAALAVAAGLHYAARRVLGGLQ